jgi:hypothetical protein
MVEEHREAAGVGRLVEVVDGVLAAGVLVEGGVGHGAVAAAALLEVAGCAGEIEQGNPGDVALEEAEASHEVVAG